MIAGKVKENWVLLSKKSSKRSIEAEFPENRKNVKRMVDGRALTFSFTVYWKHLFRKWNREFKIYISSF